MSDSDSDDLATERNLLLGTTAPALVPSSSPKTISHVLDTLPFGPFHFRLLLLAGMGNFIDAAEVAINPILFPLIKESFAIDNVDLAHFLSLSYVGMLLGAVLGGRLADVYGRRPVFQYSLLCGGIFAICSALTTSFPLFILCRMLVNASYGANIVVDSTLFCELLPIHRRGFFLQLENVFWGIGAVTTVLVAWAVIPSLGWRWMLVLASLPAFLVVVFRTSIPESPRFYEHVGDLPRAVAALETITKENDVALPTDLHLPTDTRSTPHWRESCAMLCRRQFAKTIIPLVLLWFFDSLANGLTLWLPMYLAEGDHVRHEARLTTEELPHAVSSDGLSIYLSTLLLGIGVLVGSCMMLVVIEAAPRLVLLRVGTLLHAGSTLGLAFVRSNTSVAVLLPLLNISSSVVESTKYIYTPEVFPTAVRSTAFGICSAAHRTAPVIAPFVVVSLVRASNFSLGVVVFSMFAVVAFGFSLLLRTETRNRAIVESVKDD